MTNSNGGILKGLIPRPVDRKPLLSVFSVYELGVLQDILSSVKQDYFGGQALKALFKYP